jgi:origin recognition complex subunit 4
MEKRVKSRFSHRMWRVTSPLAPGALGWRNLMRQTLIPWDGEKTGKHDTNELRKWRGDWEFAVEVSAQDESRG